ncbi:hypothetical protein Tco_0110896 [Tanacetum coccineum]
MKDLNDHIAFLKKNFKILKQESSAKYEKNIAEIVDLEKAKKELENIVFKIGQSTQTMHMLTKPQKIYDETHKTVLGYQNPLYLFQALEMDIQEKDKKKAKNKQNRAQNRKDKVKSKPKSVKVKSQPNEGNTT